MPFTAQEILQDVRNTLQDTDFTRWTLNELRLYLNDGLREIAFHKPTACSDTVELSMSAGTLQTLGEGQSLIRAIRNITSAPGANPRVGGMIISPTSRAVLDSQFANWHDTNSVPFSDTVVHVVFDPMAPREFYVYPGNDGTGLIEAVIGLIPDAIAAPANPNDIAEYTANVDIDYIYKSVLRDYILSRCFEKDSASQAAAQRAVAHKNSFMQALGVKQQIDSTAQINTTDDKPLG